MDPAGYDALVMDTQRSELLVLRGADPVRAGFRFIKTEVPDFEAYAGRARLDDIAQFLAICFATRAGGGSYYDVVYGN